MTGASVLDHEQFVVLFLFFFYLNKFKIL